MSKLSTNGAVIYEGLSQLDNTTPIVAIATGIKRPSSNPKTGPMIQVWILRQDRTPHKAAHSGLDGAICGDCPLTKLVSVSGIRLRSRRCYVDTSNAPNQVWKKWNSGGYLPEFDPALSVGKSIRMGAYGDPLAVPLSSWKRILARADGWTGYTHSWRIGRFWRFRDYVMASCETYEQHLIAKSRGWRTFQTGSELGPDQFICPNTTHGITCEKCKLCSGAKIGAKSIVIAPHGGRGVMSAWN